MAWVNFDLGMVWCLMAPSHYLNQRWLIINGFCDIHIRAISQEILIISICKMGLKITFLPKTKYCRGLSPPFVCVCVCVCGGVWWVGWWVGRGGVGGYSPPVYVLFGGICWSKQPMIFCYLTSLLLKLLPHLLVPNEFNGCHMILISMVGAHLLSPLWNNDIKLRVLSLHCNSFQWLNNSLFYVIRDSELIFINFCMPRPYSHIFDYHFPRQDNPGLSVNIVNIWGHCQVLFKHGCIPLKM